MKLAMIGLGRMGMNMAKRLLKGGHQVIAYNRSPEKTNWLKPAQLAHIRFQKSSKSSLLRVLYEMMLPAGHIVDDHIHEFKDLLRPDDILIDGGNTYYKDDNVKP